MGLENSSWAVPFCWVLCIFAFQVVCDDADPEVSVKFLTAPPAYSNEKKATFVFEASTIRSGKTSSSSKYTFNCQLDSGISSDCEDGSASFAGLQDGNHTFKVCANGSRGIGCASYNWAIDTVPPTANITVSKSFTNSLNVSAYITFSKPCTGGGGFQCSSVDACNLLVYSAGQVIPHTLKILEPNLRYSLLIGLSSKDQYGRAILVMDKDFCTDRAGNKFTRTENSSCIVHFDRRSVLVSLRTHVPERLIQLNSETRTVLATNNYKFLKVYLYFTEPILNTSEAILNSLNITQGSLHPIAGETFGSRRFGYMIDNLSTIAIVTVNLDSDTIISRHGNPVSPVAAATFLYDSERPAVKLSSVSKLRTRNSSISILIKFMEPVFGFNSSHISTSGGSLRSFHELSRSTYLVKIQANNDTVCVSVPEKIAADVAGNKNLASNVLQVTPYFVPVLSTLFAIVTTASFLATCLAAGLLTISTASLQSAGAGALSRSTSPPISDPTRNLFRIACYIQVFAISKWLAVPLPVDYYEFARALQWSIPYFSLPWENEHAHFSMFDPNGSISSFSSFSDINPPSTTLNVLSNENFDSRATAVYGSPLTPMEYGMFFENQNYIPEAKYISDAETSDGWTEFKRCVFWLAVISGSLMSLHSLLLLILRFRESSESERRYGALVFPRFEIFLVILAMPCICVASSAVIKGGTHLGTIVGVVLLGFASALQIALFSFLSIGITFGKLVQYKEVHEEGERFHWYQVIVKATLGPGKRGQWTWNNNNDDERNSSVYLTMFGPIFEDLRGPPKYMLSRFSRGSSSSAVQIIASDDETEDAEAPFIQKLFGILRIYYTFLESIKRFSLGIVAGAFSGDWSSEAPILVLTSITLFQLLFLVVKKPFIKKRVQMVEIISIACELGLFGACLVLFEEETFSSSSQLGLGEKKEVGIFMLLLFLVGYLALVSNEWYALYKQIIQLDPEKNSFAVGLKAASVGFLLLFVPQKMMIKINLEDWFPVRTQEKEDPTAAAAAAAAVAANGSRRSWRSSRSGSRDTPWLTQVREMARASFNRDRFTDPSTSRWSGFWGGKRSGSSSTDFKSKPRELYKDLEAIFASKG
ncbi:hypothetical protein Dimus_023806 [Dionaea muscipula]